MMTVYLPINLRDAGDQYLLLLDIKLMGNGLLSATTMTLFRYFS